MPKTVYIETTIPSHYFSRRTDAQSIAIREWTREWWDSHRHAFDLVTSRATLDELLSGDHPDKADKLGLIRSAAVLPENPEI